jgi:hypothetical protein
MRPLLLLAIAASACGAFGAGEGGEPASPGSDAGADATADSTTAEDASGPLPDGGPPLFHDDFEREDVLGDWDQHGKYGDDGTVSLMTSSVQASAGERSLHAAATGPSDRSGSYLWRALPAGRRRLELELDLRSAAPAAHWMHLVTIGTGDSTQIHLGIKPGENVLIVADQDDDALGYTETEVGALPLQRWVHLRLVVDLDEGTVSFERPGATAREHTLAYNHGSLERLEVGATYVAPSEGATGVWIDELTVR